MPTGYTAAVGDGKVTEFADFAMTCARAFGALIDMREAAPDAPIPDEFPVDDYGMKAWIADNNRLNELRAMTPDEAERQAGMAYNNALVRYRERQRERAATQARYEAMLDQALAWQPPTPDHVEMKNFMVQQLQESIRFDCGYEIPMPTRQTGGEWLGEELAAAERSAERHAKQHEEAVERAEQRGAWVRALRESLRNQSSSAVSS